MLENKATAKDNASGIALSMLIDNIRNYSESNNNWFGYASFGDGYRR